MPGTMDGGKAPSPTFQGSSQRSAAGTPKRSSAIVVSVRIFGLRVNQMDARNTIAPAASSTAIGATGKSTPYAARNTVAGIT